MIEALKKLLTLLFLVLVTGIFVLAETAVISARKSRLHQRADEGDEGARVALELASSPNLFLSTVQIGVTLAGILAGAYGEASISDHLAVYLRTFPVLARHSQALSLAAVVLCVTYVTLILGELVPKRLALHHSEAVASVVARPIRVLSVVVSPVTRLLSFSTDMVLRLLGQGAHQDTPVTEEEIKVLIDQGTQAGLFQEAEQDMVERVFRLGDRRVTGLMTPRTDIVWLDLDDSERELRRILADSRFSRFPVAQGSLDEVVGVAQVKDLLGQNLEGRPFDVRAVLQAPLFVPDTMGALKLMELFKESGTHFALVVDEFNGVQGVVTFNDLLEALVGDIPSPETQEQPQIVEREDGTWLVDGMLSVEDFKVRFELDELPEEDRGDFQTVGGFVVMHIGRIPAAADHFLWGGLRFEVVDMDGNRVDKVLVSRAVQPAEGTTVEER